ncbi:hypothetical protein GCM10027443_33470 [Pontibacter brevis]
MKKRNVRLLFGLVVVIFCAELVLALNVTEPFPAIIYPGFEDIPSLNSPILKPKLVVFFHDKDSLEVDKELFFSHMSNVYNNVVLSENFKHKSSFLRPVKQGRSLQATVGSRKINLDLNEVWDEEHIQEGKFWVSATLKETLKRDDFTRLEVQWHAYKLSKNEKEPLQQGNLSEKFVVSFIE